MARRIVASSLVAAAALLLAAPNARTQSLSGFDRERGRIMLEQLHRELDRHFYDPTYKGRDLDSVMAVARARVDEAESLGDMFVAIARVALDLEDSHTLFLPPERASRVDYGWRMQMIGDSCFVTAVDDGSDAARQGMAAGDVLVSVNGHAPTRATLWKVRYLYQMLRPQPALRVVVRPPGGTARELDVAARIEERKRVLDLGRADGSDLRRLILESQNRDRLTRPRFAELAPGTMLWKLQGFEERTIIDGLRRIGRSSALVLDLRGNGGGTEQALLRLLGGLFAEGYTVGTLQQRDRVQPLIAKGSGDRAYDGRLIVLVDSHSASASELVARAMQLSGRGTVIGDATSGNVTRGRYRMHRMGTARVVLYGTSVTDADVIMADGGRLEGRGVTPDVVLRPTGADLAARRDPVLAHAAALLGVELTPEAAGALLEGPARGRP